MAEEHYRRTLSGGLGGVSVEDVCIRCGVLVAIPPANVREGAVTPRMAHDGYHDLLEQLIAAHNARAELEAEARERADG